MLLLLLATIFVLILICYKIIKSARYWEERDVVHVKSLPIVGSFKSFVFKKKHITDILIDIYNTYSKERCVGYMHFTKPFLMIRDLELIKKIAVKDFDHFHDHLAFENIKSDPLLNKGLISLSGESWRRMRATLSPVFTSSKMRIMYNLITECAQNFTSHFQKEEKTTLEMKDVFSKFANDVIATTAFGVKIDSLSNPNNEFFKMGSNFTQFGLLTILKMFVMQLAPGLSNLLQIQLFSEEVTLFFRSLVNDSIKIRESEGIERPDLIHLLMEAKKGKLKHDTEKEEENVSQVGKVDLTDDHIVAQALTFFFAGFDTVSTGSCFMAHELALHPEVQKKLQIEIDAVNKEFDGKVPYETLLSMKYLDQVVCETLRLWPPAFQTDRLCVKDYVIEPIYPKEKVVFVAKGTSVSFPIMALQRDPKYFSEPNKFDPDRFSEDNKAKIIPGTYLPFGVGPRNCIGSRFALLEIKVLFFHLLANFIIVPVEETAIPLKISPKKINLAPENGFQLSLRHRVKKC